MPTDDTNLLSPLPINPRRFRCRYLIDAGSADWTMAESQIARAGRGASTVVSVKSFAGKKRKLDESLVIGGDEEKQRVKGDRKTRRSMKKAKR